MPDYPRSYWIDRARQCRDYAEGDVSAAVRERMLGFARRYDMLAAETPPEVASVEPDDTGEEQSEPPLVAITASRASGGLPTRPISGTRAWMSAAAPGTSSLFFNPQEPL